MQPFVDLTQPQPRWHAIETTKDDISMTKDWKINDLKKKFFFHAT